MLGISLKPRRRSAATREAAQASSAPELILQQVAAVIASLDAMRGPVAAEHDQVLDLQASLVQQIARCESIYAEVAQTLNLAVGSLLTRDGPPIWGETLWHETRSSLRSHIHRVIADSWGEIERYVQDSSRVILLHAGLFIATALLFGAAGRWTRRRSEAEACVSSDIAVFDHPWSAAYITSLLYTTGPLSPAPDTLQRLLGVAAFLPTIRLISPWDPGWFWAATWLGSSWGWMSPGKL